MAPEQCSGLGACGDPVCNHRGDSGWAEHSRGARACDRLSPPFHRQTAPGELVDGRRSLAAIVSVRTLLGARLATVDLLGVGGLFADGRNSSTRDVRVRLPVGTGWLFLRDPGEVPRSSREIGVLYLVST